MSTFVLVHGAAHGGWCWYKVAAQLQSAGHTVLTPDLPGLGADRTPIAEVSLDSYTRRVCQVIEEQSEPVILVGHSLGGVVISQVAEELPFSIQSLVYLTAYLLNDGQSMMEAIPSEPRFQSRFQDSIVIDEKRGVLDILRMPVQDMFYHDCSPSDVWLAQALLTPQALTPMATPLSLSRRYQSVRRAYIQCLDDQAIPLSLQRYMLERQPCEQVFTLNTSHSPFLSAPGALTEFLAAV
jgi:pimeloyl-ACP methyl ester carboxylesterase